MGTLGKVRLLMIITLILISIICPALFADNVVKVVTKNDFVIQPWIKQPNETETTFESLKKLAPTQRNLPGDILGNNSYRFYLDKEYGFGIKYPANWNLRLWVYPNSHDLE
jgi:hypothetical protein